MTPPRLDQTPSERPMPERLAIAEERIGEIRDSLRAGAAAFGRQRAATLGIAITLALSLLGAAVGAGRLLERVDTLGARIEELRVDVRRAGEAAR